MTHRAPVLRTLALTAAVLSLTASPAWAAWYYIGPGARSVHLTLPTTRKSRAPQTSPAPAGKLSLTALQQKGRLSGVLAHNRGSWHPHHWTAAGHGSLTVAIRHLVPGHALQVQGGVQLPTVSWPAGSASVALYQVARSAGVLLVITHQDVDVFAG